jgi:RNA polymerase sigma-70 factor (ECF subfamily)
VLTLDQFLMSVEGKAYRMAMLAVKNEADALDIVQDTMIKLATNYGHLEADGEQEQWRPLFYKILQNCIMDFHRKDSRIKRWFVRSKPDADDKEDDNELDNLSLNVEYSPEQYLQQRQMGEQALQTVDALPVKQQQCFLLRCWEGFSVQETAQMMNISEGSVKTHYHRALQKLQEALNEKA